MLRKLFVWSLLVSLRFTVVFAEAGDDSKDAEQLQIQLVRLDDEAKQTGENQPVFESLSKRLNVPVEVLQADKESTGFGFGQLFIAHSLAQASGSSFETVAQAFKDGKGWGVIAKENNLKVGKVVSSLRHAGDDLKNVRTERVRAERVKPDRSQPVSRPRGHLGGSKAKGPGPRH